MRVAIASDHGGLRIKHELIAFMNEMGITYHDFGCSAEDGSVDYPDYAKPVAKAVASGEFDRGVLVCGTGIGMSIAANKVDGVRCALLHDTFSAEATRAHNNSNVIAMGERVIGAGLARLILKVWLETAYEGGRHDVRVAKIEC